METFKNCKRLKKLRKTIRNDRLRDFMMQAKGFHDVIRAKLFNVINNNT